MKKSIIYNWRLGALAAGVIISSFAGAFQASAEPVTISVIDVAGDLQLSQPALEKFQTEHPDLVSSFVFTQATAPELAGKLKAQQDAGRVDIDFVLTGNDALAAGMEQGLWTEILPKYQDKFPDLEGTLSARRLRDAEDGDAARPSSTTGIRPARCSNMLPIASRTCPTRPKSCSPGARPIPASSCMRGRPIPVRAGPS